MPGGGLRGVRKKSAVLWLFYIDGFPNVHSHLQTPHLRMASWSLKWWSRYTTSQSTTRQESINNIIKFYIFPGQQALLHGPEGKLKGKVFTQSDDSFNVAETRGNSSNVLGSWECLKPSPEVGQGKPKKTFLVIFRTLFWWQVADCHPRPGTDWVPWCSHRSHSIHRFDIRKRFDLYIAYCCLFADLTEEFGSEDGGFQGELPEGRHCRLPIDKLIDL